VSPRGALCDELLDLLDQIETDLTYGVDVDDAQRDGAETVINAVCDVIDGHILKNAGSRRGRKPTGGAR
jgi:hypothetical protein